LAEGPGVGNSRDVVKGAGDQKDARAVVLSGSIGRGHGTVAEVCEVALSGAGYSTTTLDCMRELGWLGSRAGEMLYRAMLSRPALYDAFHFSQLRMGGRLAVAGDAAAARRLVPRLEAIAAEGPEPAPLTLALSVFATGAAVGAALAERRPRVRTVVLCTDATAHRMWVHDGTDLFLATSELAAATVRRYRQSARVAVIPPPVRPQFYNARSSHQAREALGLGAEGPYVLIVSGGWGIGPLAESAVAVARNGLQVLAVAGNNRKLLAILRARAMEEPRIHPYGFTDRMAELMAASDVVVTGPGQTCHEVRAIGRPMVLLDAVPGHGRENLLHELVTGGAVSCSPDAGSVAAAVDAALDGRVVTKPWAVGSPEEWERHFAAALSEAGIGPG
jgi:processive 1,2-diacylglycerol beta-glucosyltransferase